MCSICRSRPFPVLSIRPPTMYPTVFFFLVHHPFLVLQTYSYPWDFMKLFQFVPLRIVPRMFCSFRCCWTARSQTSSRGTKREIFFGILELFAPFALKNTGYTFRLQSECLWQFQNPNYQRALRFFRVTFPPIWVYWRYYKMHRITEALFACF